MKIKVLANLCKRTRVYRLYDRVTDEGELIEQWLGTNAAIYPLFGVPYLTTENLAALFDITEKQAEKMHFSHTQLPASINVEDVLQGETMLDKEAMTLGYGGRVVRPLVTRGGLEFIDNELLSPLSDVADVLELYERRTDEGGVYFAAKAGLMITGVIMPLNIIELKLVESTEALALKLRAAFDVKVAADEARAKERNAAQMKLNEGEGEQ